MSEPAAFPTPATTIALVRHGETDWNRERRIQGTTDIPLNDTGRAQAVEAADRLAGGEWQAVYASTLSRAAETGALMASRLGLPEPELLPALIERSFGVLEGLDHHGRAAVEAQAATIDGLEPRPAVVERSAAALIELAARHPGGRIVVVTHGGVIHSLVQHLSDWTLPGVGYVIGNGSAHLVTAAGGALELAEPELLAAPAEAAG
ncbi:histidine phosphatase family protein [Agromyces soli]